MRRAAIWWLVFLFHVQHLAACSASICADGEASGEWVHSGDQWVHCASWTASCVKHGGGDGCASEARSMGCAP